MTTTLELIDAISKRDAGAIETAFNAAMAEKISSNLDSMRISVAKSMFNQQPQQQEEQPSSEE